MFCFAYQKLIYRFQLRHILDKYQNFLSYKDIKALQINYS